MDRWRLRAVRAFHPGLELDPTASPAFALGRYAIAPGAHVRVGPGVLTDRIAAGVRILAEPGAVIEIGEGTWLRSELGPVVLAAFAGARLTIGPDCLLNGCHLSAKRSLTLDRRVFVGPGTRVFDADQHDLDDDTPERMAPVHIGSHTWIASDVTILRGVTIGDHAVVGARSIVTRDVPDHGLAYGLPARVHGRVGDRLHTS